MNGEMEQLYDFSVQADLIRQMQKTSLAREDIGLAAEPLVGSVGWWDAIEGGDLRRHDLSGEITRERWGSMADWPEFELSDSAGTSRLGPAREMCGGMCLA